MPDEITERSGEDTVGQREGCRGRPSSNTEFWNSKLSGNMERDRRNREALVKDGWKILVVWECETKDQEKLKKILRDFLSEK